MSHKGHVNMQIPDSSTFARLSSCVGDCGRKDRQHIWEQSVGHGKNSGRFSGGATIEFLVLKYEEVSGGRKGSKVPWQSNIMSHIGDGAKL